MAKDRDTDEDEPFLRRWSRRKSAVDTAPANVGTTIDDSPINEISEIESGDADEQETPAPLTDADMPPLETLNENSDYSLFMSEGVSEELRKLALRKLFSAAQFNVRDGLDDYDDDFRSFTALGDLITSDMKHQKEMRELRAREAEEQEKLAQQEMDDTEDNANGETAESTQAQNSEDDAESLAASGDDAPDPEKT